MVPTMDTGALMSVNWTAGCQAGLPKVWLKYEPRIAALEVQVAELAAWLTERESRPPKTSQNSSLPPSLDPPGALKRRPKRPVSRKRGVEKGHSGHTRQMVEPNQVGEVIDHHTRGCPKCQTTLSSELPEVKPIVTEQRQHTVE